MNLFEVKEPILGIPISSEPMGSNPLVWSPDNRLFLLTRYGAFIFEFLIHFPNDQPGLGFRRSVLQIPHTTCLTTELQEKCSSQGMIEQSRPKHDKSNRDTTVSAIENDYFYKGAWSEIGNCFRSGSWLCLLTESGRAFIYENLKGWSLKFDLSHALEKYMLILPQEEISKFSTSVPAITEMLWTTMREGNDSSLCYLLMITDNNYVVVVQTCYSLKKGDDLKIIACLSLKQQSGTSTSCWTPISGHTGFLTIGRYDGVIDLYECDLSNMKMSSLGTVAETDVLISQLSMKVLDAEKSIYLVIAGYNCIVRAYLISVNGPSVNVIDSQSIELVCSLLTGLHLINTDKLYVSTGEGAIVSLEISLSPQLNAVGLSKQATLMQEQSIGYIGFTLSPNRCLWSTLETIMLPYDHLDLREPHSVNIFSVSRLDTLVESCKLHQSEKSSMYKDVYENIRLLLAKEPQMVQQVSTKILDVANVFSMRVKLILCKVLAHEEHFKSQIVQFENIIWNIWAKEWLSTPIAVIDQKHLENLNRMTQMLQNAVGSKPYSKCVEVCPICSVEVDLTTTRCERGHPLLRCRKSHILIAEDYLECKTCKQFYHPVLSQITPDETRCLFCLDWLDFASILVKRKCSNIVPCKQSVGKKRKAT